MMNYCVDIFSKTEPLHTVQSTFAYLQEFYDNRLISLRLHPTFLPCSVILEYLKNTIFMKTKEFIRVTGRNYMSSNTVKEIILQNIIKNTKRKA